MRISGTLLELALSAVQERFAPSDADLVAIFEHKLAVPEFIARSLARAFAHYWSSDAEAACAVALPRIETLVRELLKRRGAPVFTPQKGPEPGQIGTLGALLRKLADYVPDESWNRSLQTLLVKPGVGLDLRNEILHGLREEQPQRAEAALVLQAALFLVIHLTG